MTFLAFGKSKVWTGGILNRSGFQFVGFDHDNTYVHLQYCKSFFIVHVHGHFQKNRTSIKRSNQESFDYLL